MYRNSNWMDRYRQADGKKKVIYCLFITIVFAGIFLFSAFLVGSCYHLKDRNHTQIWLGIHDGIKITSLVFLILMTVIIYTLFRSTVTNKAVKTDTRGVSFMRNGVKGTAHFADEKEIREHFNIGKDEDNEEMIYGQLTDKGEKVVFFRERKDGAPGTRHTLLIANSGQGKSFAFNIANVLQAIKRKHSVVLSDPSGEVYSATGSYARKHADYVGIINLAKIRYSDFWNIVQEVIDPQTERVDSIRLQLWGDTFMMNTPDSEKKDFFYVGAQNLIETAIAYASYIRESHIIRNYNNLYQKITQTTNSWFYKTTMEKFVSLPWCENELRKAAVENFGDIEQVNEIISEIKRNAPRFSINEIYDIVYHFKQYMEKIELVPDYHPARKAYQRYLTQEKDTVRDSAIQGAQSRFKIFDNDDLREALSHDGIDLKEINKRHSVIYVIVPDNNETLKPIASLFFSFFFKDVQEVYDEEENRRRAEETNRCLPVMAMLDEFASLGVISGSASQFQTIVSDCRKRKIYICMIIQAYSQLEGIYGQYARDVIVSNCTVKMLMGAGDLETMKFWSQMTGVATAMDERHGETQGLLGSRLNSNDMTVGSTSRNLITMDEAGNILDEVQIKRQGCQVFRLRPYPWIQHPAYRKGKCERTSYFNMPTLEERLTGMYEGNKDADSHIKNLIEAYKPLYSPTYVVPVTAETVREEIPKKTTVRKKKSRKKKVTDIDAVINENDSEFYL
ncbi:MAG: type IV secretory system conjugative DNA transfer family protein [Erysipelotrichaceae bacterium]|nr:type IV secretory system conjugative DNA transfer family protein [Erysipelotrichaceae bacterium]